MKNNIMKLFSKVIVLSLILSMVSIGKVKATTSFKAAEVIHGITREYDNNKKDFVENGKLYAAAGSVIWVNVKELEGCHNSFKGVFNSSGDYDLYLYSVQNGKSYGTEEPDSNDDENYYWIIPEAAVGDSLHITVNLDNRYFFESEDIIITPKTATLDTTNKTITINSSNPLPGKTYGDISLTKGVSKEELSSYNSTVSLYLIPVEADATKYITLYERWSEWMMPEYYIIDSFKNNNEYSYYCEADFSNAGSLKSSVSSYTFKTPKLELSNQQINHNGNYLSISGSFANGTVEKEEEKIGVDLGAITVNLSSGQNILKSTEKIDRTGGMLNLLMALYEDGSNKYFKWIEDNCYVDLDKDGHNDLILYVDDSNAPIYPLSIKKDSKSNLKGSYKVSLPNSIKESIKGPFSYYSSATFIFSKKTNTLTVKAKTATIKYKKLKKKNLTLAISKVATVSKAQGKVTYAKVSGNKKITINKTNGKITVKKKLKKGKYKVKIKVTAAGNTNYYSSNKTITFTIKVK